MLAPALLAVVLAATPASTDTLSFITSHGYFVWGGDLEGGGPFMWPDEAAPGGLAGVEAELAELLAQELSRATGVPIAPRFFQGQWDTLPSMVVRASRLASSGARRRRRTSGNTSRRARSSLFSTTATSTP